MQVQCDSVTMELFFEIANALHGKHVDCDLWSN